MRNNNMLENLMKTPWWVSIIVLIIVNAIIQIFIPMYIESMMISPLGKTITDGYNSAKNNLSAMFSLALIGTAVFSIIGNIIRNKH